MKRLFDPCKRHRQNLAWLASGALTDSESRQALEHLATCPACQAYLAEMKSVAAPLLGMGQAFATLEPSTAARARWAAAIHTAGQPELKRRRSITGTLREWYAEVFWPYRRIWASLATVWLVICAGQFSLQDHPRTPIQMANSSPAQPQIMTAMKERQMILSELLADHLTAPREADRPKVIVPRPQSERAAIVAV